MDDAEAPALDRMLAEHPAGRRRQVVATRPPDVPAAMAFTGIAMAWSVADDDATRTAREALDPKGLHAGAIRHKPSGESSLVRVTA